MDRTTPRRLSSIAALALAAIATLATARAQDTSAPISGTFALLGGTQKTSAQMTVRRAGATTVLDVVQSTSDTKRPIVRYSIEMTQLMHMIVVRDDFQEFHHVHPTFDAKTGRFQQSIALNGSHRFYVYADTTPTGLGQQVFRFVLQPPSGAMETNVPLPPMSPSVAKQRAGPYVVSLARTRLSSGSTARVDVTIERNGKPATDLHAYLGAPAHAVFIDVNTLAYAHVHPMLPDQMSGMHGMGEMDMSDMKPEAGPKMMMHVPPLPVDTYKLWLQFMGGSTLYTVPYTIVAR